MWRQFAQLQLEFIPRLHFHGSKCTCTCGWPFAMDAPTTTHVITPQSMLCAIGEANVLSPVANTRWKNDKRRNETKRKKSVLAKTFSRSRVKSATYPRNNTQHGTQRTTTAILFKTHTRPTTRRSFMEHQYTIDERKNRTRRRKCSQPFVFQPCCIHSR